MKAGLTESITSSKFKTWWSEQLRYFFKPQPSSWLLGGFYLGHQRVSCDQLVWSSLVLSVQFPNTQCISWYMGIIADVCFIFVPDGIKPSSSMPNFQALRRCWLLYSIDLCYFSYAGVFASLFCLHCGDLCLVEVGAVCYSLSCCQHDCRLTPL